MMPTPSSTSEAICVRLSGLAFRRAGGGRMRSALIADEKNDKPTYAGEEKKKGDRKLSTLSLRLRHLSVPSALALTSGQWPPPTDEHHRSTGQHDLFCLIIPSLFVFVFRLFCILY
jgi:hypothetical protein